MPLQDGCEPDVISANIAQLIAEGYARPVAVAVAIEYARQQGCEISSDADDAAES